MLVRILRVRVCDDGVCLVLTHFTFPQVLRKQLSCGSYGEDEETMRCLSAVCLATVCSDEMTLKIATSSLLDIIKVSVGF